MMRKLHIDFGSPRRSCIRWGGWGILFCAAGLGGYEGYCYFQAERAYKTEQVERERVQALLDRVEGRVVVNRENALSGETVRHVGRAFSRIHAPWLKLFESVESALHDSTALLGFEPDLERREVRLRIEAKSNEAMLQSLQNIASAPGLSQAYLEAHQVFASDPQRPVRYTVVARWDDAAKSATVEYRKGESP